MESVFSSSQKKVEAGMLLREDINHNDVEFIWCHVEKVAAFERAFPDFDIVTELCGNVLTSAEEYHVALKSNKEQK